MSSTLRHFFILCLILATGTALAQTQTQPTPPSYMSLRQARAQSPSGLSLEVGAGVGQFQDLQPPVASSGIGRVDGSKVAYDSSNHTGPLLNARLGWSGENTAGGHHFGLAGARLSSLPSSDPLATGASYVRFGLDGSQAWTLDRSLSLITGAELRRSIFRNTDSGHYLDSGILRAGLAYQMNPFALSGTVGIAPMTRFGYMQSATGGRSGGLAATASSLYEWNVSASWQPHKTVEFVAKLNQEAITADMQNITAYRALGLDIAESPYETSSRHYKLTTTDFIVGAARRF